VTDLSVSAAYARCLIEFAGSQGVDEGVLASTAGIDLADLDNQDFRVPMSQYKTLMRLAKEMTGDPALPLHYGATVDMKEISVLGLLFHTSESIVAGIEEVDRFMYLLYDVGAGPHRIRWQWIDGKFWGIDTRRAPVDFPELTETTLARFMSMTRSWTSKQLVKEVHFDHPEPAHGAEYERIFNAPVKFDAGWNAMRLDEFVTHKKERPEYPRYMFGILSEHAEKRHQEAMRSRSMRAKVEQLIMPVLHTGTVTVDRIAERLGMSRQTLYRALKEEAITFEKVLDDLRHELALHYLRGGRVSINEIAYLVGFSDCASFSRAFKRWTGQNPRSMRGRAEPPSAS
jgi:AraC-like DNA-binding protein